MVHYVLNLWLKLTETTYSSIITTCQVIAARHSFDDASHPCYRIDIKVIQCAAAATHDSYQTTAAGAVSGR